jgi:hypothetical protein
MMMRRCSKPVGTTWRGHDLPPRDVHVTRRVQGQLLDELSVRALTGHTREMLSCC